METYRNKEWLEQVRGVYSFAKNYMARNTNLPYHNFHVHAVDVAESAMDLGKLEKIAADDEFVLVTAALLHDLVYVAGASDNEEKSAVLAAKVLPKYGYSLGQVDAVQKLIMATKLPTNPQNQLEKIMCDSDLDNLGRPDFMAKGNALRKEFGVAENKEWYVKQRNFLKNHHYYTASAQKLGERGLNLNIKMLENKIASYS